MLLGIGEHGSFRSENAPVLIDDKDIQVKIHFIAETNISHIDFLSMQMPRHSVRDRLACINN